MKRAKRTKNEDIKYAVFNKETKTIALFRFKCKITEHTGVSARTLTRNIPHENDKFVICLVKEIKI